MKIERFLTPQDDLQKALDSAPKDAFVHLAAGIYRQKIVVRTPAGDSHPRSDAYWAGC